MAEEKKSKWFPLESNEEVMNKYIQGMGVEGKVAFNEVLSLEDWAIGMVPQPVFAVMMVYPIKPASEAFSAEQQGKIDSDGQTVSENVIYMKQITGNACGTIGILHSLLNTDPSVLCVKPDSYFDKFSNAIKGMSPMEIAEYLDNDDELEATHEAAASEGQTACDDIDVNTHFVCFTQKDGCLYELDGRKKQAINHGSSSADSLLTDACAVIKGFMDRDPGEVRFTICALTAAE